jgi:hypothetical protein
MNSDILKRNVETLNGLTPVLVLVALRIQIDVVLAQHDLENRGLGPLTVGGRDDVTPVDQSSSAVVDGLVTHPGSQESHEGVSSSLGILTSHDEA